MKYKYPVYQPSLKGNEKKYVNECLDSTWISSKGRFLKLFEDEFAKYINVKYATGVCNGTIALHLALVTLGIGSGDEVIVPTFTYISCANSVTYTGAAPVFVDSLPDTWQMDPDDIKKKITSKTKAIMAVHLYGHSCDIDSICSIAKENDLFLIEDCAEAFGSKYKNQNVGTFGDIATFSFFGNKTITTGEGGMVITNDETLFDRAVHFKGQGLAKYREYWHDVIGYNYRMTNICAAIGLAQLERADELIAKKRQIAKWYDENLKKLPVETHKKVGDVLHSYWMYNILVENPQIRDELREYLNKNGIETRPAFYPIHTMPIYSINFQKHSIAEDIALRAVNLPSYPDLEKDDLIEITTYIRNFYEKRNNL
ncbi:MAG: DegT/DnrJ/EryC1/StrS aminotransferase family protein [Bacteroidales bacterium]|nr:DegT/DnrJ/EryC1/StrS aminotransferase family protein [Bacteroidales bacterium]